MQIRYLILKRSGGLNEDAYLKGLVFSRKNEQVRERAFDKA